MQDHMFLTYMQATEKLVCAACFALVGMRCGEGILAV